MRNKNDFGVDSRKKKEMYTILNLEKPHVSACLCISEALVYQVKRYDGIDGLMDDLPGKDACLFFTMENPVPVDLPKSQSHYLGRESPSTTLACGRGDPAELGGEKTAERAPECGLYDGYTTKLAYDLDARPKTG